MRPLGSNDARWTRRAVLALGVGAAGLAVLPRPARAAGITVGQLTFTVPDEVAPVEADPTLGSGWQWLGRSGPAAQPTSVVLARADLRIGGAAEVLGLILAGSATGLLPGLTLADARSRPMPGGGEQNRIAISYLVRRGLTYHGELLIGVREDLPAAVLVVVGDDQLTAGTIDGVLESARWLS